LIIITMAVTQRTTSVGLLLVCLCIGGRGHSGTTAAHHWRDVVERDPSSHAFNIIYIKVPKCASSTTAGIFRRIAHHTGSVTA
jgi:hypothetical protein